MSIDLTIFLRNIILLMIVVNLKTIMKLDDSLLVNNILIIIYLYL